MASRELKIPLSYLHICETSTATVPNTIATAASVGADVNGRAVQVTARISVPGDLYHTSGFLSVRGRCGWLQGGDPSLNELFFYSRLT